MLSAIVGINWGDEGKGRMVDLLSQDYDVVVRYQGGNNAGHTVINHLGKFILNLMPSGILRPEVVNVMGNGMVIDLEHLHKEMGKLVQAGVKITPENLKISDRAIICLPYHVMQDCMETQSSRLSATPVFTLTRHSSRARRFCLRHSWVRCGTSTLESTRLPPPPTPSLPMHPSARVSQTTSWTM